MEDVDHDKTVVIEKMLDALLCEIIVGVGELGDALDGVDAIDEGDDLDMETLG